MRYLLGLAFLVFLPPVYSYGGYSGTTSKKAYIAPNAQTGLVSDFTFTFTYDFIIGTGERLVFSYGDVDISELPTIQVYCTSYYIGWTNFSDYGAKKTVGALSVAVFPKYIEMTANAPHLFSLGSMITISGVRCNVVSITQGHKIPTIPIEVTTTYVRLPGWGSFILDVASVATYADPIDLHLQSGPAYIWSSGKIQGDGTATIRVSEVGAFTNGFETQSNGSAKDATQLLISIRDMPTGLLLKNAVIAGTTSPTVTAVISPVLVFPQAGPTISIPVNILGQNAFKAENIDITLTFDVTSGTESIAAQSVNATVTLGPEAPSAIGIPFDPIPGAGIGGDRYFNNPVTPVSVVNIIKWPRASLDLALGTGGAASFRTTGDDKDVCVGYAVVTLNSGADPYGTAVFSFEQNEVVVSEAAVPASPPTTSARMFIDYRTPEVAGVDINTGLAVVNRNSTPANIKFTLRGMDGVPIPGATGKGILSSGAHRAIFINQLKDVAPDFNLPADFSTTTKFGALDITSDLPVSVLAIRLTVNQRDEVLYTSTPVADLTKTTDSQPLYFPQFVDGGGYITTLVLLNTSNSNENGTLTLQKEDGSPLLINNQIDGKIGSVFSYNIQPGAMYMLQTDGSPANFVVGSVRLAPTTGLSPVAAGVFSFTQGGFLVTESGVPAVTPTTHARIYIDQSEGHSTGLAIVNADNSPITTNLTAYKMDGSTSVGSYALPGEKRHEAKFVSQFISGLPDGFTGVLDISSPSPFAAVTLRSLINGRGNFLLTTFPVADAAQPAPAPIIFPQIAYGGGYITEFVLLSVGGPASTTLSFYNEDGTPFPTDK